MAVRVDALDDFRPAVSSLFAERLAKRAQEEREREAEEHLLAAWHDLNEPFAHAWERAGNRLREERLMGLHPKRVSIPSTVFQRRSGPVFDAAWDGTHVTVTNHGRRDFVIVSAPEYDRLKLDARLLKFEDEAGAAPEGWPEE